MVVSSFLLWLDPSSERFSGTTLRHVLPGYGCNSDSQKSTDPPTHFFSFPSGKSVDQKRRRQTWVEFCKRKAFQPSSCTRICSLHFKEEAYEPGSSPQFLERLGYKEKFLARLKNDAVPTLNKALENRAWEDNEKGNFCFERVVGVNVLCH
jgi:hypothetical protein